MAHILPILNFRTSKSPHVGIIVGRKTKEAVGQILRHQVLSFGLGAEIVSDTRFLNDTGAVRNGIRFYSLLKRVHLLRKLLKFAKVAISPGDYFH